MLESQIKIVQEAFVDRLTSRQPMARQSVQNYITWADEVGPYGPMSYRTKVFFEFFYSALSWCICEW